MGSLQYAGHRRAHAPDWLRVHAQPEWVERYDRPAKDDRAPSKKGEREALVQCIGADGAALRSAMGSPDAPAWLREVPALEVLRQVWVQNYVPTPQGPRWRTAEDGLPASATFVSSPYDTDAHYARKRSTTWVGYKAHLTPDLRRRDPSSHHARRDDTGSHG